MDSEEDPSRKEEVSELTNENEEAENNDQDHEELNAGECTYNVSVNFEEREEVNEFEVAAGLNGGQC